MIETRYKKSLDPVKTDGRDINPALGHLSGEAAQQIAGPVEQHMRDIAQRSTRAPEGTTYYGRPMLKEPVWKWVVPLYYYAGGAAGASLVLGAAAQFDRSGRLDDLVRGCHQAGIIGSALSAGLLVFDLGRPSRFLNMLRVFRPTSPMNMGAWILCAVSPAAIMASLFAKRRGVWGWIGEASGVASGIFGLGLATYTGVLVGNSAIPIWQESRRLLPILFGASAMASAGSLFQIFSDDRGARRITYTFGTVGRVAELAAAVAMEKYVGRVPLIGFPLKTGASGALWRTAAALTAGSLVATLLPRPSRKKRIAAGVLGTLGSLILRYAVHQAGVASARDPRASLQSA